MEDLAWQNSIPNTFGKESDKLGRPLSNSFGPGFLQRVAAAGKDGGGVGVVGKALLEDDEVKTYVRKYAGNSKVGVRVKIQNAPPFYFADKNLSLIKSSI